MIKWIKLTTSYPPLANLEGDPGRSESVIVRDENVNKGIAYYHYPNDNWVFYYRNGVQEIIEWSDLSSDIDFYYEMLDHNLRRLNKDRVTYSETTLGAVDTASLESKGYIQKSFDHGRILIRLTNEGMNFITEGGFREQLRRNRLEEVDKDLQRKNWKSSTGLAKWSIVISIAALLIALATFLFPNFDLLEWLRN